MDASTFANYKDIYGVIALSLAIAIGISITRNGITVNKILGIAILGWSSYISLTQSNYDPLDDWIITVPLIFISLIYNLYLRYQDDQDNTESAIFDAYVVGVLYLITGVIATLSISQGMDGPTGLYSWFFVIYVIRFTYFEKIFDGWWGLINFTILLYPILYLLANSTVSDPTEYASSRLDNAGIDFYEYSTILLSLSFICKIGLTLWHITKDNTLQKF
jgi:hypothetical protein